MVIDLSHCVINPWSPDMWVLIRIGIHRAGHCPLGWSRASMTTGPPVSLLAAGDCGRVVVVNRRVHEGAAEPKLRRSRRWQAFEPSAPWGSRGRRFKSCRPDSVSAGRSHSIHDRILWLFACVTQVSPKLDVSGAVVG
jgi:hypothetical protein